MTFDLKSLEARLPVPAIRSFTSAVSITQESGGNLASVLMTLGENLRHELVFQGKLSALTAQGRLSSYVVSAMPFMLMAVLYLVAPDLIAPLFTTGVGHILLALVVVMIALGAVITQKIITIEV